MPFNKEDIEELAYLREKEKEIYSQIYEITTKFDDVRMAMTAILQDRFKTVETEIDKNLEEEKKVIAEKVRKKSIEIFREIKANIAVSADEILHQIESIKTEYLTTDNDEQALKLKAVNIGVDVAERKNVSGILSQFEELKSKVESIKEESSKIEISDKLSRQEMRHDGELSKNLHELYSKLEMVGRVMEECSKAISNEKMATKEKISSDIVAHLRESITSKVEMDLMKEVEVLNQKKDSLWDKITGKAKVKAAHIQNLKLKAEFVRTGGLKLPNGLDDMKEYISKYALVVGKESLPQDALCIMEEHVSPDEITSDEKAIFEMSRPQSMLLPVKKSKKEILANLQSQNDGLDKKIQTLRGENISNEKESDACSIFKELTDERNGRVESCLYTAICYASELTEEERRNAIGKQITLS